MTETPPPRPVLYVTGHLDQEPLTNDMAVPSQTDGHGAPGPAAVETPRRRSVIPLLIGGLAVLVVGLAGAVAVLATRGSTETPTAAPTSWTPIFATTAAAPYSPPPPQEVSAAFGETLTLSGPTDKVLFTVAADKRYTKTKYGTKPKNGILYGIKVTIEVIDGSAYACSCDFAFVSADGTVYEGNGHEVNGGLAGVELNRKQKAAGIVVFDIPVAAAVKGSRIELREGSNNQGFWEVP